MDFQFMLPMRHADLLNASGDNYYVKNVYTARDIPERLNACKQALYDGDPFYIFDHFDTFFAVIENSGNDGSSLQSLMRAFNLLYMTVDKLGQRLAPVLASSDAMSNDERKSFLNLTKMTMFLIVNTVRKIDGVRLHMQQQQQQQAQGQKKRGKQAEVLEQYPDWDSRRTKFLIQLFNIMQFNLEKLWSPPVAEENFVILLCDICYRTLELHIPRGDNNRIGDTIFQIFGTALKRYNHAMTFPVRILQILRTIEHAAPVIASGICLLHEEYGITSVFSVLCKDIVETLTVDSADTVVSRNFSNFLMELANIAPKLMIPHISMLCDELLNCESHVLRNCILQIMGDAIVGELTSEELSEELKESRDEFLQNLLMHLNDVSAHVRAKALQIWHHIKMENAVPLTFQLKVLREAVDRLEDKTSSVRKYAIQLIKAFLECNPYSAKLTLEELIKKHAEECEKMEKLSEVLGEERKKAEELLEQWNLVVPEILPYVEEHLKAVPEIDAETQENYEDLVQRINGLLLDKKYKEAIVLVRKADHAAGNSELSRTLKFEEQCEYFMVVLKSYMFLANGCKDSNEELGTLIKTVQFLQDSIEFSKVISKAMPKLQELLYSKTTSDVFEAVDLFTTGYLFGIKGTEVGMRQILYLVWSSDKEKRDTVSNAYKKVLFVTDQTERAHALKVVQNLTHFLNDLDLGHYTSMELLIREWVASDDIDALIIQVLFERFTMKLEGTTENESRLALQLLIMAADAKSSIASANMNVIETIAFSERARKDPRLYTGCLEFMLKSIEASLNAKYYKRYNTDHPLVLKVSEWFQRYCMHPRVPDFDRLAMRTFEFIYRMCQTPDVICTQLMLGYLKKCRSFAVKLCELTETQRAVGQESPFSQPMPETQPVTASQFVAPEGQQLRMPAFLLTRFIFCIGYITLKELIFLDLDVYNNMKYRQELTEECEKKKKKGNQQNKRRTAVNLNMSATESLKRLSGSAAEPQQEPDEDLVGATAEDNIAELINHICEEVLINNENGLLSNVVPYVIELCKYPSKYNDQQLQQAATLALLRFMLVSSQFCAAQMAFLMNILLHTKNIKIKCNIVIGLGDLTFRFPNIIEPWAGHFYSTLHEEDTELRLTVVKTLSHLLLHEMLRVKGQIADLALCIVDPNEEIRNITLEFFKEIAVKSNILYNVLPEIISRLSDTNLNLEEEKYRLIMRQILSLIQKDRQVETLVEKLCLRFPVSREERQWRDIAYCLSLLSYNERAVKKLIDNLNCYKDKVQNDEVYQSFKLIISNTSKLAKPELKAIVTELETRINECLKVKDGEEAAAGEPSTEPRTDTQTQTQTQQKRGARSRQGNATQRKGSGRRAAACQHSSSATSDSSDDSSSGKTKGPSKAAGAKANNTRATESRSAKSKQNRVFEDSEESSSDELTRPAPQQRKRGRK